MGRRRHVYSLLVLVLMIASFVSVPFKTEAAGQDPALDFAVVPSQTEFLNPPGDSPEQWAKGSLNITIKPQGSLDNIVDQIRKPVDVVFVFDKSGSMGPNYGNKIVQARKAIDEAVKVFESNKLPNDRFGLVTFDSDVHSVVPLTADLQEIKDEVYAVPPQGGTNYTQSLQKAYELLGSSSNNKFVIFLTDGMPTNSKKMEHVKGNFEVPSLFGSKTYKIDEDKVVEYDSNGSNSYYHSATFKHRVTGFLGIPMDYTFNYNPGKAIANAIRDHGLEQARNLGNQNTKLYSIGFGTNQEVDMDYLNQLSQATGSKAYQGNSTNLNELFRGITTEIGQMAISGVKIRIKINERNFPGLVTTQETSKVNREGDYAVMNLEDVPYVFGQNAPQTSYSLPLTFSASGTYTFNDIQLVYKDLNGKEATKSHRPVSIVVKDKVAPAFDSTISYLDPEGVSKLVITGDPNHGKNRFTIKYKIVPTAKLENNDAGELKDIKIIQPLPESLTVYNKPSNVKVYGDSMEITLDKNVYSNKKFTPSIYEVSITLQANWAMKQRLQNPTITYNASSSNLSNNFGVQQQILPAPTEEIIAKVILEDGNNRYEGDYFGNIAKLDKPSNTLLEIAKLTEGNNKDLTQPIKLMVFTNEEKKEIVKVVYSNDVEKMFPLVPQFKILGQETGKVINDQSTVQEMVAFKLDDSLMIPGKDVSYEYRITANNNVGTWTSIKLTDEVKVNEIGDIKIEMRAKGGFAKENIVIEKNVTIERDIVSIEVTPSEVTMFVGETVTLEALVNPVDALNKDLVWVIEDNSILSRDTPETGPNTNRFAIRGKKTGITKVIVKSKNGKVQKEVVVTIIDDFRFKLPSITMEPGQIENVEDLLIYNAGNGNGLALGLGLGKKKNILDTVTTQPDPSPFVEVYEEGGRWYIKAIEVGYATVVATGKEKKKNGTAPEASMIVIVKKPGKDGSGGNGNSNQPNGKW